MEKILLDINTSRAYGLPQHEQVALLAGHGFDGIFPLYIEGESLVPFKKAIDEHRLTIPFVHAPYEGIRDLWHGTSEAANAFLSILFHSLEECARIEVDTMVCHAFIGFFDHTPTEIGLERFGRVIRRAEELGVKIAFENTEGLEYLHAILNAFPANPYVGFCWDSGHEQCYNHSVDLLSLFADRVFAVHLNDNAGICRLNGEPSPLDDAHLLPYDGIIDWTEAAAKLDKIAYKGPMTFEIKKNTRSGSKCPLGIYESLSVDEYLTLAFLRASKVAARRLPFYKAL